jgi:K(+)-stimulated pyrophosphate-energized sodium pump
MENFIYVIPCLAIVGLIYTFIKARWVTKQDAGNDKMKEIAGYIAEGAMAFLKAEYRILSIYVLIAALLLGFMGYSNPDSHWTIAVSFIIGAIFSVSAGYIGMRIATKANVRTAQAARTSLSKALAVSFGGGSVMGMGVAGLAVLGLGGLFIVLKSFFGATVVDSAEMIRTV